MFNGKFALTSVQLSIDWWVQQYSKLGTLNSIAFTYRYRYTVVRPPAYHTGINWLIDWMAFYATFNSILVISRRQFTLFMFFLDITSTRLGSEVSCPRTLPRKKKKKKKQGIPCGSNPGPLDYELNTLPLSVLVLILEFYHRLCTYKIVTSRNKPSLSSLD